MNFLFLDYFFSSSLELEKSILLIDKAARAHINFSDSTQISEEQVTTKTKFDKYRSIWRS